MPSKKVARSQRKYFSRKAPSNIRSTLGYPGYIKQKIQTV